MNLIQETMLLPFFDILQLKIPSLAYDLLVALAEVRHYLQDCSLVHNAMLDSKRSTVVHLEYEPCWI